MFIEIILLTVAFIGSALAGVVDLKTTEIPDWIPYVMIGVGIAGNLLKSYLVLSSDGVTLEIMEDTKQKGRVFTQAACKIITDELQSVLNSNAMTTAEFEQEMIKAGRAKKTEEDIWIENDIQGGMYNVYAYINAQEAGYAYLKIFEATKNTPLSIYDIALHSKKTMNFSKNANLKFLYKCLITINEGNWGVYYPARFELWFVPDSGKEERKLLDQIFKVEGWTR